MAFMQLRNGHQHQPMQVCVASGAGHSTLCFACVCMCVRQRLWCASLLAAAEALHCPYRQTANSSLFAHCSFVATLMVRVPTGQHHSPHGTLLLRPAVAAILGFDLQATHTHVHTGTLLAHTHKHTAFFDAGASVSQSSTLHVVVACMLGGHLASLAG